MMSRLEPANRLFAQVCPDLKEAALTECQDRMERVAEIALLYVRVGRWDEATTYYDEVENAYESQAPHLRAKWRIRETLKNVQIQLDRLRIAPFGE